MVQHADIDHSGLTGVGGGVSSGTAFPGSPSSGDRFFRTNIRGGMEFIYDGTRWLSVEIFSWLFDASLSFGATADTSRAWFPLPTDYQVYLTQWHLVITVSGSATWVATLTDIDFDQAFATLDTQSTAAQTGGKAYHYTKTLGTILNGTAGNSAATKVGVAIYYDEQTGTASCIASASVEYRIVAT